MWKKIAVAGVLGAAVLGAGTAALAASGSPGSSAAAPAQHAHHTHGQRGFAMRALHGTWVTGDASKGFVTHDEIRGQVTGVSATSISVKAADGTAETFSISSATKVHVRADGTKPGTISEVKLGDRAIVVGTGMTSLTAKHVVDLGTKK
jgi:uncharacterized NAD(P)/FAD-binding protein YdhS